MRARPPDQLLPPLRVGVALLWAFTVAAIAGAFGSTLAVTFAIIAPVGLLIHVVELTAYSRSRGRRPSLKLTLDVLVFGMPAIWSHDRPG